MLGEPLPSQYDWRFSIFGFPIRVAWTFWILTAALGYQWAMSFHNAFRQADNSPGVAAFLVVWIVCVFISILIHELGHALAFRYFGISSQIVLYQFGGMAIPSAGFAFNRAGIRKRLGHFDHIIIALAGPALQFLSAIVVAAIVIALGLPTMFLTGTIDWLVAHGVQVPLVNGLGIGKNPLLFAACECYVYVSIFWPLINLLPIFPLDGGKVVQHGAAIVRRSDGLMEAHLIGTVFGFLVAWWFFQNGGSFNAMLFLFLAWDNMTALQRFGGPPRW